jgi:hypothetical protein
VGGIVADVGVRGFVGVLVRGMGESEFVEVN